MYELKIRLSEKNILARVIYKTTVDFCKDYLVDFDEADITVEITPDDIKRELEKSIPRLREEGMVGVRPSDAYLETLALYRKIAEALLEYDVLLFHGSAVTYDGEAYLFSAKSGTGKSTHTRLWRECFGDRVEMINDDKPLILISDDCVKVFGTPWNGKHRLGSNKSAPLSAICILERAEANSIRRISHEDAYPQILSQTYRSLGADKMIKTLALIDRMLDKVKVYRLSCNMEKEAAMVSLAGMSKGD